MDNIVLTFFESIEGELLTILMEFFSFLGSFYFIVFILLVFAMLCKNEFKYRFILGASIVEVINLSLKYIVARNRPISALVNVSNYSFPSGHAMMGTFVYGFLAWYVIKKTNIKKNLKVITSIILIIILVLISTSRLYLRVHYLSDVVFGTLFGLISLFFFIKHYKKLCCKQK